VGGCTAPACTRGTHRGSVCYDVGAAIWPGPQHALLTMCALYGLPPAATALLRLWLKLDSMHRQLAHLPCAWLWCALVQCGWCGVVLVRRCADCARVCTSWLALWVVARGFTCYAVGGLQCILHGCTAHTWAAGWHLASSGFLNGMNVRVDYRQGLACGGHHLRLDDQPRHLPPDTPTQT
jgi:hypothetical protein